MDLNTMLFLFFNFSFVFLRVNDSGNFLGFAYNSLFLCASLALFERICNCIYSASDHTLYSMPTQRRQTLRSIPSSFLEHSTANEQGADDSSTGTVQHHPLRSLSLTSTEPEKLPLTVRNRNLAEDIMLPSPLDGRQSRTYSGQFQPHTPPPKWNIRPHVRKSKSISALDDPNISFAVVDSVRLARQKAPPSGIIARRENNAENERPKNPLQRWVRTLHRRNVKRQKALKPRDERWSLDEFDNESLPHRGGKENAKQSKGHKKSSSWASSGFVTAVKSATVSLTTMSIAPPSKCHSSALFRGSEQGSRRSPSLDQSTTGVQSNGQRMVDDASIERAYKRRDIIQEIVRTEESYVADLRLLIDVSRKYSLICVSNCEGISNYQREESEQE